MPYRSAASPEPHADSWRALFHRWFVEFNPLYLLSAALVLGGSWACARELASRGSVTGPIAVAAIAEVYAGALVLGAALLVRLGLRRPATMLGLVAVLYQWDLTLHTETCAALGRGAGLFAGAWLLVFVAKLRGLAWALRLSPSRELVAAAVVAGAGLAAWPFAHAHATAWLSLLVASWVFAIGWLAQRATLVSAVPLDAWGQTVLRRATLATFAMSALLLGVHVIFWQTTASFSGALVVAALVVASLSSAATERRLWGAVGLSLASVLLLDRLHVHEAFALAALALGLRARGLPVALQRRVVVAALAFGHLALWSRGWGGDAWPPHSLAVDLAFTCVALGFGLRARAGVALVPVLALWTHAAISRGVFPRTRLELGATALGLGFALLGGSLAMSWRLRRPPLATTEGATWESALLGSDEQPPAAHGQERAAEGGAVPGDAAARREGPDDARPSA